MAEGGEIPVQEVASNESERRDATFPTEQLTSSNEWKGFIEENVPDFDGNIESAARLMMSYQKGRDYIYQKFSPKFGDFENPDIMIVLDESKVGGSPFGSVEGASKIFVTKSFLQQFSNYNQDSISDVTRQDGSLAISASPDQIFELHGIEETHHSLFHEIKGSTPRTGPNDTDLAIYDSQQDEYRALRWQVQYAVERKFPEKTISVLRSRLAEAEKVRSKE